MLSGMGEDARGERVHANKGRRRKEGRHDVWLTDLQTEVPVAVQHREIAWKTGFEDALSEARRAGRQVLLDFSAAPM
jgi:hypothetical protein